MPIEQAHTYQHPDAATQADLVRRGKAAWSGPPDSGAPRHGTPDDSSGYAARGGLGYVVLRQGGAVLAVYRVRSDNLMLRRMKRPPKGLK